MPAPVVVQSIRGVGGSPTCTVNISSSGAGNLIAVAITEWNQISPISTVTGVTDNKSQTYIQAANAYGSDSTNFSFTDIWYFPNTVSGVTSVTITVNDSAGSTVQGYVYEVSGIATTNPLDSANHSNNQSATATPTTATITTTASNDFILTTCHFENFSITSVNSPYTYGPSNSFSAYYIPSTIVTNSAATFNGGGPSTFSSSIAAFLAVAASGQIIPFPFDETSGGMQNLTGGMRN